MRDFRKLDVWARSHALVLDIYADTARFPRVERFGLAAQLRSAALSISSNIAEGAGRSSKKDYARLLDIAIGSANEVAAQLLVARDLEYIEPASYAERADHVEEVRRKLAKLRRVILADF